MRKMALIKLLESIKGNPEVVLWNGFVGDWQSIDQNIEQIELVKHSREFLEFTINHQNAELGLPPLSEDEITARVKEEEWDLPNQFVEHERLNDWYGSRRKRLVVLSGKARGKSTWDRLGTIEY